MKQITFVVASLMLVGCMQKQAVEVKSIEWYKENPVERTALRRKCAESEQAYAKDEQNCRNAEAAAVMSLAGPNPARIK